MTGRGRARILIIGDDDGLRVSCGLIFRSDGYEVEALTSRALLEESQMQSFDAAVICQSINAEAAARIAATLRSYASHIRILRMRARWDPEESNYDQVFEMSMGPGALRQTIGALLHPAPQPGKVA
jgi:DNA-binding response OmpR family regulator